MVLFVNSSTRTSRYSAKIKDHEDSECPMCSEFANVINAGDLLIKILFYGRLQVWIHFKVEKRIL
jgi:hypothetical protein